MINLTSVSALSTVYVNVMELNLPNVKYRVVDWETFAYLVEVLPQQDIDVVYASEQLGLTLLETEGLKKQLTRIYELVMTTKDQDTDIDFHLEVNKGWCLERQIDSSNGWFFQHLLDQYQEAEPLYMAPYETGYDADDAWYLRVPTYYSDESEELARQKGFCTAVSLDTRPYKTSREDGVWKLEVNRFLTKTQEESGWAPADYFFEAPYKCTYQDFGPDKGVWRLEVIKHVSNKTCEEYEALGFMPAVNIPS